MAILAVLLYHARIPGFGGGFVGVDVFFVISGFLITGLLLRELKSNGRIDLPGFYARRARRLLPAALLVILVTVVAAGFVLSTVDFPSVAGDGAAAALYVSNYRFALSATDYFASDVAPSPLLHYWSLGVEEQFYLFWPLLLMVGWRVLRGRRLVWLIGAVGIASFVLSVVVTDVAAPWAFYSLPTRAWQLALGALIALGSLALPARLGRWPLTAIGLTGIGLIGVSAVALNETVVYPGFAALLPAGAAALVIVAGARSDAFHARLLAMPPMRFLGRISYSLYLWHWPLLLLVPAAIGRNDLRIRVGLAGVAIVIAWLSTRYVEAPFRFGRLVRMGNKASIAALGAASLAMFAVTAIAAPSGLMPVAVPQLQLAAGALSPIVEPARLAGVLSGPLPADLEPRLDDARSDLPRNYRDGCRADPLQVVPPDCAYGDVASPTIAVIYGDSHAGQWLPALDALAADRHWRLVPLIKAGCPPVELTVWQDRFARPYDECDQFRSAALKRIEELHPQIAFVSSARDFEIVENGHRTAVADDLDTWRNGLTSVLSRVVKASARTFYLADTPLHAADPVTCLARNPQHIEACPSTEETLVDTAYRQLETTTAAVAGAVLISTTSWLCSGGACPLVLDHYLVYRDTHHLTATIALALAPQLAWTIDEHAVAVPRDGPAAHADAVRPFLRRRGPGVNSAAL